MVTSTLSLLDNFNQLTPYAVGFDRVFDQLQNYASHNATSSGFPPYNIRKEASNIYRGISYRKFNRKFTLADDIVVNGASLENGMLVIKLERIVPEEKKPRKVEII